MPEIPLDSPPIGVVLRNVSALRRWHGEGAILWQGRCSGKGLRCGEQVDYWPFAKQYTERWFLPPPSHSEVYKAREEDRTRCCILIDMFDWGHYFFPSEICGSGGFVDGVGSLYCPLMEIPTPCNLVLITNSALVRFNPMFNTKCLFISYHDMISYLLFWSMGLE